MNNSSATCCLSKSLLENHRPLYSRLRLRLIWMLWALSFLLKKLTYKHQNIFSPCHIFLSPWLKFLRIKPNFNNTQMTNFLICLRDWVFACLKKVCLQRFWCGSALYYWNIKTDINFILSISRSKEYWYY